MCLSLQGNLYIFIVGHSEGTVLCLLLVNSNGLPTVTISFLLVTTDLPTITGQV